MGRSVIIIVLSLTTLATANADIERRDLGDGRANIHQLELPAAAPEVDPAGMLNGLLMLGGALAVLRGTRRKR